MPPPPDILTFPSLSAPTTHNSPPIFASIREQQLYAATLEAVARVREVLISEASAEVREAATAVLAARGIFQHWESVLGGMHDAATLQHRRPERSLDVSPVHHNQKHLQHHLTPPFSPRLPTPLPFPPLSPLPYPTSAYPQKTDDDAALLAGARDAMAVLHLRDRRRDPEAAGYAQVLHFLLYLCATPAAACEHTGPRSGVTASRVMGLLGLDVLVAPWADVAFGLDPLRLPVGGLLPPGSTLTHLYAASIAELATSLPDTPASPWYPWVLARALPLSGGDVGGAVLGCLTAMRAALGLVLALEQRARDAGADEEVPPMPLVCRCVYTLLSVGSLVRVYAMVHDDGGDFTATEIWCGSACVPSCMLELAGLLSAMAAETEVRQAAVGNWLYALRGESSLVRSGFFPANAEATTAATPAVVAPAAAPPSTAAPYRAPQTQTQTHAYGHARESSSATLVGTTDPTPSSSTPSAVAFPMPIPATIVHASVPMPAHSSPAQWLTGSPRRVRVPLGPVRMSSHMTLVSPREFDVAGHLAAQAEAEAAAAERGAAGGIKDDTDDAEAYAEAEDYAAELDAHNYPNRSHHPNEPALSSSPVFSLDGFSSFAAPSMSMTSPSPSGSESEMSASVGRGGRYYPKMLRGS